MRFAEINHFASMCELAYCSHGLRPELSELSYGSHFFQDLVESGIFYAAFYQGTPDCRFDEAGFDAFPDRLSDFLPDDKLRGVICVYDFGPGGAVLYSEVESQDCYLGLL